VLVHKYVLPIIEKRALVLNITPIRNLRQPGNDLTLDDSKNKFMHSTKLINKD
jgi:hypothetical protein